MNKTRALLKQYSQTDELISAIQNGQVVMSWKVHLDNYLKSQVELMKYAVTNSCNCGFKYNGFFSTKPICTRNMTAKEQWGFEIILSRLILCSIYQAGSYEAMAVIFGQTTVSYQSGYSNADELLKNLKMAFSYFTEAVSPLQRLDGVFRDVQQLFSEETIAEYP